MTIHYGKRNPGLLTAVSPGDTLYIPLQFYNDSGASISISNTLVAGDIEIFKNGSVTQRATDSGYAILGDTGNFDNRIGFKGISIALYNTADDASFYAVGSTYWVAIDSVTVDGRTVRFFPAVFEIGENRANIVQVGGDTGAANYLRATFADGFADTGINQRFAQIQSDVDTGIRTHINDLDTGLHDTLADYDTGVRALLALRDTGAIATAVWAGDTGLRERLGRVASDVDTGLRTHIDDLDTGLHAHISDVDTGVHSILQTVGVLVLSISDTGVNQRLAQIQSDVDTGLRVHITDADTGIHDAIADLDSGLRGILVTTGVNLGLIRGDTGGADRFYRYTQKLDTGGDATVSSSVDTGLVNQAVWQANAARGITAIADTGMNERFGRIQSDVDTGLRTHIDDLDTGLANLNVNINQVRGDTGAADRFFRYTQKLDTGGDATVSAAVDTGLVNQAVWQMNANRKLTVDTGIADQVWKTATAGYNDDTGTFGELLRISSTAVVDTGQVNQAVWQANAVRGITAIADTGLNDNLGRIRADVDTGLRLHIDDSDTGLKDTLADYDTGIRALLALRDTGAIATAIWAGDTGIRALFARVDTGAIATAVWAGDTGLRDHITNIDTGLTNRLNVIASDVDTGLRVHIDDSDTGVKSVLGLQDTGFVANAVWNSLRSAHTTAGSFGESDTGVNQRFSQIQFDVDTGLRTHINDLDTGLHDTLSDYDTGVRALLTLRDTGAIANAVWGFATRGITASSDTGVNDRLGRILSDTDTGLKTVPTAIKAKTDSLTFTSAGMVDANLQRVNDVLIAGTGDTGTSDTWRPA